jgi:hypothetical protein
MSDIEKLQERVEKLENEVFKPTDKIIEFLSKYEDYHVPGTADANIRKIKDDEVYLEYPIDEHSSPNSDTTISDYKLPDGWNIKTVWMKKDEVVISFIHNSHYLYQEDD